MDFKKVNCEVGGLVNDNLKKLENIFPSVIKDGEVDFEELKELLGDFKEVDKEKYEMNWVGKKEAKKIALTPLCGKTLKYIEGDGKNEDNTENLYIEGDNLEVLKLLQNSYYGKVKMIYIDPPYNTGNDFIYNDKFKENKELIDILEGNRNEYGDRLIKNLKTSSHYHSKWLNMMYPRLKLARNLLKEDGVIFISIDDKEVNNLKKICDEVFGENNFRNYIIVRRRVKSLNIQFADKGLNSYNIGFEYILVYSKSDAFLFKDIRMEKENIPQKGSWNVFWSNADRPSMRYDLLGFTPKTGQWRWSKEKANEAVENYKIYEEIYSKKLTLEEYWISQNKDLKFIRRIPNGEGKNGGVQYWIPPNTTSLRTSDWTDLEVSQIKKDFDIPFDNPKSTKLIKTIISSCDEEEFIVLDFFSGSSTTAHSVMESNIELGGNRKFIMVQLPEQVDEKSDAYKSGYKNICDIGKERIRRAGDKILKDNKDKEGIENLDIGFKVFRVENSNIRWENQLEEDGQIKYDLDGKNIDDIDFVPGTKDIDVVYETLLRHYGIPLTAKIEKLDFIGNRTYTIQGSIIVCLETQITKDIVDKISELEPIKVIFRDSAFGDDISLKQNSVHRLNVLIEKNNKNTTHVVEFI
ncbi:site-specific DNA-methyltransferase [Romboutsia ilealis]|uniref:site-specific DNA-methyltransferase n=6 Tax=Romboutsia TaxID=1501226 RepID=UPI00272B8DB5|nr:site-specific DNA-methyltransferase [Romboutsia ilealis]